MMGNEENGEISIFLDTSPRNYKYILLRLDDSVNIYSSPIGHMGNSTPTPYLRYSHGYLRSVAREYIPTLFVMTMRATVYKMG
jgi:hypothetical protein